VARSGPGLAARCDVNLLYSCLVIIHGPNLYQLCVRCLDLGQI